MNLNQEELMSLRDDPNFVELKDWAPTPDQIYFIYEDEVVKARFDKFLNMEHAQFSTFYITKKHYKERMTDVVHHLNYFLTYYDTDKEFFISMLSLKFMVDNNFQMTQKLFKSLIMRRIITPSFINKVKAMANDLYTININTDKEGKYKSTPKITNDHARVILAVSFCIRFILPLCIHYSNVAVCISDNKDYIACFDKIFMDIITAFEKDDYPIYSVICKFVKYRVDRTHTADGPIWEKKKQLYGINYETYLEDLIHEVIIVKSLYKLAYDRSIVSFIDGIISHSFTHFKYENFKFKPVEIDADDGGNDNDDYLSHAEALEMSVYRIDESNMIINDVNIDWCMKDLRMRFNVPISKDEFNFYMKNCVLNNMTQMLLHSFYSKYFDDSNAIYTISKKYTIELMIRMKKFLLGKGMVILPQICTAKVRGKFKENVIKNSKFIEKFNSSAVYQKIICTKFRYIKELNPKEDPIIKRLSTIINSQFELVDYDPRLNGMVYDNINLDKIIDEFLLFLSII